MRELSYRSAVTIVFAIAAWTTITAQELSFREMRWRDIGPTRAGRARAAAGVATQPNTFYAGFDNGGVWRSAMAFTNPSMPARRGYTSDCATPR